MLFEVSNAVRVMQDDIGVDNEDFRNTWRLYLELVRSQFCILLDQLVWKYSTLYKLNGGDASLTQRPDYQHDQSVTRCNKASWSLLQGRDQPTGSAIHLRRSDANCHRATGGLIRVEQLWFVFG